MPVNTRTTISEKQPSSVSVRSLHLSSLQLAKKLGCDTAIGMASSLSCQKIYERLGFKTVKEIPYEEVKDETGEQLVCPKDATTSTKIYLLKL